MLTSRAWWFLFWTSLLTFLGVAVFAPSAPTIPILGFTLLLWFLAEWTLFSARVRLASKHFWIDRQLLVGDRVVATIWAGTSCRVRLRLGLAGSKRLPFVAVADISPAGLPVASGTTHITAAIEPGQPLEIEYTLTPEGPGVAHFAGVEVRIADLGGLFYHRMFLRVPVEYLILPPLSDDEGQQRATKRFNTLPPPGEHRLRRPGGGSELLDLRDYRPGDPPKTIAWKVTARRDRLVTKEFESDVPVRCLLFLDASNGTRLGEPGKTPLARTAALTAAVAQAAAASRDLVGLCVFNETAIYLTKPARTRVHTMRLLRTLAETAGRQPENLEAEPAIIQRMAFSLAQERYPDLLEKRWNTRPFGLFWRPLLDSRRSRWLLLPIILQGLLYYFHLPVLNELFRRANSIIGSGQGILSLVPKFLLVCLLFFLPTLAAGMFWLIYGLRGFFSPFGKRLSQRKQLAALFASKDYDSPAAIERYIADDDFYSRRCARFLSEHYIQTPPVLFDQEGKYRYRGEAKVKVLADALARSISVARDNELYVIIADLVELAENLEPLLRAIRTARSRHHQVLVLLAWPADLPPPKDPESPSKQVKRKPLTLGRIVGVALREQYQRQFDQVRLALVRAGGSVVRVSVDDPVRLVLERLEQLRHARIRR